jgi:hypothetical protein
MHIAHDPGLWSLDSGGIFLRCLVDTAITFGYLAQYGKAEDFQAFKQYGEGREKLLMLHLQDNYPGGKTRDGKTQEDLLSGIGGGFWPEFMDIDIAWWTKKSARDLAMAAGMEKVYRLVYDPASGDLHGTWTSLKSSNLIRCAQPLHRFHWLPSMGERPALLNTIVLAQQIYSETIEVACQHLGYPRPGESLDPIATVEE